jgi:amino-acid N-acetyltransferase
MKIDLPFTYSGVRPGEAPVIQKLLADCELHTEDLSSNKLKDFIVCRQGARIVGVVGVEIAKPYALLRSLAVAEAYRNQGVAANLVDSMQRYALSRGVGTLYLLTMTADKFFARQGFAPIERHTAPEEMQMTAEFKNLCPAAAVCMCKVIANS